MTQEQFIYWLHGFMELSTESSLTEREAIIRDHLQTVFHKVTPNRPTNPTYLETASAQSQTPPLYPIPTIICLSYK